MENETNKCVHTEHCCRKHGCKYGDEDCPVETARKEQSFPCEYCEADDSYQDYLYGTEGPSTVYVLYRIESHPDRQMTFLGVHSTMEKAEAARDKHRATGKSSYYPDGWPVHEYDIVEAQIDGGYSAV